MDRRGPRSDTDEPVALDSCGERARCAELAAAAETRSPGGIDGQGATRTGGAPGTLAAGIRIEPPAMGRTDVGDTPEATLRHRAEGAPSADLDASTWLQHEARESCLPASPRRRCPTFPTGSKKNSAALSPTRLSCFKTRPASPCIRAWASAGLALGNGCGYPRPVSTTPASTFPA